MDKIIIKQYDAVYKMANGKTVNNTFVTDQKEEALKHFKNNFPDSILMQIKEKERLRKFSTMLALYLTQLSRRTFMQRTKKK